MPEKSEDVIQEDAELTNKANKCKKILKLFRKMRTHNIKNHILESDSERKGKRGKKEKFRDGEERKEVFKKNMENSWADLPNTLQRKKENISQDILSEFHDSDSSEPDNGKPDSFNKFGKVSRERSYDLRGEKSEATCGYFRQKKDDELDVASVDKTKSSATESLKQEKFSSSKLRKSFSSEVVFDESEEDGQVYLEKIRKLGEDDSEFGEKEGKDDSYDLKSAVDEINLLFQDLIARNGEDNYTSDSVATSDSGNSEPQINLMLSSASKVNHDLENKLNPEPGIKFRRSDSSDSLLNDSSASYSSSSDLSQQETGKSKEPKSEARYENETNVFEKNAEITYVDEANVARPRTSSEIKTSERKNCCNETVKLLTETNKGEVQKGPENSKCNNKEGTQYSDLIFPLSSKNQSFFVNDHFAGDVSVNSVQKDKEDSKQLEENIVYQELSFGEKTTNDSSKNGEEINQLQKEQSGGKHFENEKSGPAIPLVVANSLSEEQKSKRKSAEAVAKELSSHVFCRRNQSSGGFFEKKNITTISITNGSLAETPSSFAESGAETNDAGKTSNGANKEIDKDGEKAAKEEEEKDENWESAGKNRLFGDFLQYFSAADWRKAVALGSKRGISSVVMETIVEEPETDAFAKLTVREILRRFEDLGNKQFNDRLCMTDDERTATLKQIHQTLKCLEEKVKNFENWSETNFQHQQYFDNTRHADHTSEGWTGRGAPQKPPQSVLLRSYNENDEVAQTSVNDGKHSLLQFAIHHFRQSPEKFEMLKASDGSVSGSLKVIENKNKKNKEKGKSGAKDSSEWTWKEQVDLVKFTANPIEQSLLQLDPELSDLAVECFLCLMRYMGDLPMPTDVSEVKCVYTILMHCHKYEQLRDEVYCQLMKQTTNNKSIQQESCQRGWRLFSIVAAYFSSSDTLKPFLFKYLETAAYDKRRAYHGTAMVCLQNLRKTFKYGGRKNVPSVEEITAISAGRNSKRQIYRLPGGTEKVVNTKSTTVVQDVIEELCVMINVVNLQEMEEFSVYCIVEGDTFTMPLAREEYILDVTTELHKSHQVFYLIFCRSVWYFPLRLDSQLYVEVVFNQIAPDYLEGLLLILPGESLEQEVIYDISKIAALLHRAADMTEVPTMKETKFLLPKPALSVRDVKPSQWVNMVQSNWQDCENLTTIQAKAQVLDALSKWPLFGSSFFAVKKVSEPKDRLDHILALNRNGVHFIDLITHETLLHYPFSEVISTRKVKSEDGTLFLDMKCGNLMQQRITRLQTDQAHEISRLIRQYITMQQRMGANQM